MSGKVLISDIEAIDINPKNNLEISFMIKEKDKKKNIIEKLYKLTCET